MLSRAARIRMANSWHKFINPRDIEEAYIVEILFLRLAGMFPYKQGPSGFEISYPALTFTFLHFSVYAYVNFTLVCNDPLALAKPIVFESGLVVASNLIIKAIGILVSLSVFLAIFTGMKFFTIVLNRYVVMMELLGELGVELRQILKKMLFLSATATIIVFLICLYILSHSYVTYERITNEKATTRYYYAVILANYYKNMTVYQMGSFVVTTYFLHLRLNEFLKDLLQRQIRESEAWARKFRKVSSD